MATRKKKTSLFKVGLLGATIGAVGSWFLFGTETGKKKRAELAALAEKLAADVKAEAERLKAKNEPMVHDIIETVAAKYRAVQSVDPHVLEKAVDDLKCRWNEVRAQFASGEAAARTGGSPATPVAPPDEAPKA